MSITVPESVKSIGTEAISSTTTLNAYHNTYAAEWAINNNRVLNYLNESEAEWNAWHGVLWRVGDNTILRIKGNC